MSAQDARVIELQLIVSMYPNSLHFFDEKLATYLEESAEGEKGGDLDGLDDSVPIEFVFSLPKMLADLYVTLPPGYPEEEQLKAHLRLLDNVNYSSSECKSLQVKANTSLREYMVNSPKELVNVFGLIQWVEDFFGRNDVKMNKEALNEKEEEDLADSAARVVLETVDDGNFYSTTATATAQVKREDNEDSSRGGTMTSAYSSQAGCSGSGASEIGCRLWIYSHHIYSSKKRRIIGNLAHQLNLSGFCRPGKPGFICVEGTETDCSNFWLAIRSQNWQRISLIERCTGAMARERLFTGFQEVAMTQSDFFKFLQEKRCDSLIRGYLGL